jgi:hypothetical protein
MGDRDRDDLHRGRVVSEPAPRLPIPARRTEAGVGLWAGWVEREQARRARGEVSGLEHLGYVLAGWGWLTAKLAAGLAGVIVLAWAAGSAAMLLGLLVYVAWVLVTIRREAGRTRRGGRRGRER